MKGRRKVYIVMNVRPVFLTLKEQEAYTPEELVQYRKLWAQP